ncbi:MAG: PTS transporter subunit EIIC, partial [Turicibacter sp.]
MDYTVVAKQILERVGGVANVESVIHCMTRLRFTLKDETIVSDEQVKKTKGVMGVMKKSGQYQIIIGNDVAKVHQEILKQGNFKDASSKQTEGKKENQGTFSYILDVLAGCVSPIIPALIAAAMIKVLLTVLPMVGLLEPSSQTYQLLSVIGDGAFFFMPVLIAASAAKKFNANLYLAISLACIMVHPSFIALMNESEVVKFIGIPVVKASYAYSVIPVILGVWILSYVERFVDKITPVMTKNFLKPLLIILIAAPIVLMTVGPIGAIAGELLSSGVYFIQDKIGWLAVALIAGFMPFIVMTGMHHAFTPVKLASLAVPGGYEALILVAELCSNLAQGSAAMAVAFKTKNKDLKQIASS